MDNYKYSSNIIEGFWYSCNQNIDKLIMNLFMQPHPWARTYTCNLFSYIIYRHNFFAEQNNTTTKQTKRINPDADPYQLPFVSVRICKEMNYEKRTHFLIHITHTRTACSGSCWFRERHQRRLAPVTLSTPTFYTATIKKEQLTTSVHTLPFKTSFITAK